MVDKGAIILYTRPWSYHACSIPITIADVECKPKMELYKHAQNYLSEKYLSEFQKSISSFTFHYADLFNATTLIWTFDKFSRICPWHSSRRSHVTAQLCNARDTYLPIVRRHFTYAPINYLIYVTWYANGTLISSPWLHNLLLTSCRPCI